MLRKREMRYVTRELMHWGSYVSVLIVFPVVAMMCTFAAYSQSMCAACTGSEYKNDRCSMET